MSQTPRNEPPPRTSELLEEAADAGEGERVTLGRILDRTGGRAHGLVLMLLGLPEMVPMIGLSAILATPIFLIGAAMLIKGADPPLPGWLRRRSVPRYRIVSSIDRSKRILGRLDRVSRPRWAPVANAARIQGFGCMAMAAVLAFPMPGINIVAASGVVALGLGILQRDGLLIALALLAGAVALAGAIAVVSGAAGLVTGS